MKKNNLIKTAALVLCALFALSIFTGEAKAIVAKPTTDIYCVDAAEVLSSSTEAEILEKAAKLDSLTGAQVVVVTVDFLDGMYSDDYAKEIMNSWGVGDKTKNNGVVILLCPGEGKFWLLQGAGLEADLTSGELDNIIDDYLVDDFDNGDYDEAALNTFNAIIYWMEDYYNVSLSGTSGTKPVNPSPSYPGGSTQGSNRISFGGIILIVIIVIVVLSIVGNSRRRRRYNNSGYTPAPIFRPRVRTRRPYDAPPQNVHRNEPKERRNDDDDDHGGFWGGFGGGSSGGSSGSGRSGGGFGGGFGGGGHSGGGSFGGGGSRGGGAGRK